jgi:hypothetical protein
MTSSRVDSTLGCASVRTEASDEREASVDLALTEDLSLTETPRVIA